MSAALCPSGPLGAIPAAKNRDVLARLATSNSTRPACGGALDGRNAGDVAERANGAGWLVLGVTRFCFWRTQR